MNSRTHYLLLMGFAVVIVKSTAQQQTQPDRDAVKTTSEVIFVQPLTTGSNTSKIVIVTNQLFLKSMSGLMGYDARIGPPPGMDPLRFGYGTTNPVTRVDARPWRLGIEQAERINLMQMNEYRESATLQNASGPTLTVPAGGETILFNAK